MDGRLIELPQKVALRGAVDVMLCLYNGRPPFTLNSDASRLEAFIDAADYFQLQMDRAAECLLDV